MIHFSCTLCAHVCSTVFWLIFLNFFFLQSEHKRVFCGQTWLSLSQSVQDILPCLLPPQSFVWWIRGRFSQAMFWCIPLACALSHSPACSVILPFRVVFCLHSFRLWKRRSYDCYMFECQWTSRLTLPSTGAVVRDQTTISASGPDNSPFHWSSGP